MIHPMIILASDHAGFQYKQELKKHLQEKGHKVEDFGAHTIEKSDDYPDFIIPAAKKVAEDPENNRGIIFGGSGQGEAMAANRVKKVRATVFYGGPEDIIHLSKEHNNANILSIGARFISVDEMKRIVDLWLSIEFSADERHVRRIKKIDELS